MSQTTFENFKSKPKIGVVDQTQTASSSSLVQQQAKLYYIAAVILISHLLLLTSSGILRKRCYIRCPLQSLVQEGEQLLRLLSGEASRMGHHLTYEYAPGAAERLLLAFTPWTWRSLLW